jgi:hypothetical protein
MMLRRLRTIRHLIQKRDFDELALEVSGLINDGNQEIYDELFSHIVKNDWVAALNYCNKVIANQTLPTKFEASISGLRTHINLLRTQISVKQFKIAEANQRINHFRMRHNSEIGMLLSEILRLRAELLFLQLHNSPEMENHYLGAKKDYREYTRARRDVKKIAQNQLDADEKIKAKKLFREASKLCHPDVVNEELQEIARQLFAELNEAYANNDLRKIEKLLDSFRNHNLLYAKTMKPSNQLDGLQALSARLQAELAQVDSQLLEIEGSEVFKSISRIEDLDAYFLVLRQKFEDELSSLNAAYKNAKQTSEN